jgi:tRNA/tmRNA/rRNA uracil-C5-methylase (TrmA/RlmC/RlmD family)
LYAGAGLFTAVLAEQVGPDGLVIGVEASAAAVGDATANLADLGQVRMRQASVTPHLIAELGQQAGPVAAVVLDPPRSGAGPQVMAALCALLPRTIVYVACDPAALARDSAVALARGWTLAALGGYDAFPMTHHVECIATFRQTAAG